MSIADILTDPIAPPPETEQGPLDEMVRAVEDEIEAVRKHQRANLVSVANGRRVAQGADCAVYEFAVRCGMSLRDDTQADCELDGESLAGTVLAARDGTLTLAVPRDLGPTVRTGHVVLDNLWLLRALRDRLHELASTHATLGIATVDRLLGRAPIHCTNCPPPDPPPIPGRRVLEEQQLAVSKALGSDGLYVWGPAGTGKSTTVADITAALVRTDSVLAVASTNHAVDGALLKILDRLGASPLLAAGNVLRLGPIVNDELRDRFGDLVSFDRVVGRRMDELREELARVHEAIGAVQAELEGRASPSMSQDGRDPVSTTGGPDAVAASISDDPRIRLGHLLSRARSLEERVERVPADVMRDCRILATTVHRAYLPGQVDRAFDTVIIDEAGAVMGAMAVAAAARARRRVICAGDFRQLGAPVYANTILARRWLARDVFTIAGIPGMIARGRTPDYLVALRRQFRMAPDIAWLANGPVYGGILLDDVSVTTRPRGPLGQRALVYIDTSGLAPRTVKHASGTRTNALHAFLVRALIARLYAKEYFPTTPDARDPLAIITPYRGQAELISRHLAHLPGLRGVEASTAHRLQGGERDIVIADFPDSVGPALGRFMTARRLEEESAKLLTVMLTRARLHLVVVANFDFLLATAPADGLLREFLLRIRARGRQVDARSLLRPT